MKYIIIFLLIPFFLLSQDYSHIYNDVKKIPNKKYSSINELHSTIIKSHYSDTEKVYAFAKFITDKIAYGKRARTPLNTINTMEGVCQDYTELFQELCKISSIENNFVTGMGVAGVGQIGEYYSNHAWNVVKLDGRYVIFDLTWASGYGSGDSFRREFKPKYFNPKPEEFIRDHFPDDTKWQLLENPISKKDYINAPFYDPEFKNLSLKNAIVRDSEIEITFNSSENFSSCWFFKWKLNEYGSAKAERLDYEKNGDLYKVKIVEVNPGAYKYHLSFGSKINETVTKNADGTIRKSWTYDPSSIKFILVTPNYVVTKPSIYDKKDPWGLIEAYHYLFYKNDFNFFKTLNPNTSIRSLDNIKYSKSLNKSLKAWYGNYRNFYTSMRGGDIYYKIDNFRVILSLKEDGYTFKELQRETLRLGKSGYGVKELQKIFGLVQTGNFDKQLEYKVKIYQQKKGLKVDGIVGGNTYISLGI